MIIRLFLATTLLILSLPLMSQEQTAPQEKEQATEANEPQSDAETPQPAPATNPIQAPISLIEQFKADIAKSVDSQLLKPMLAGPNDFLTITQPDTHSVDKGTMILLPEWSQAATDVKAMNFLRSHLPKEGWTTITIQPLLAPENYPSQQEKPNIATEENSKAVTAYVDQLTPVMEAVMEAAANYPGIFVVIGQGNNAAMLMAMYQQDDVAKPNAFISLSGYRQSADGNKVFAEQMAMSEIPTLDLVLKRDVHWVEHFADTRRQAAKQEMKPYYRQREIHNFRAGYYPTEHLAKEIKGWLTTIGW
ncbi:DUF3530 family protein [Thalassotalea euphylliae]|uniref:DUF3530 family protein n=1 Tax=Thalassotalea euphylliae TaxID=1655234 RepID=UPI0036289B84